MAKQFYGMEAFELPGGRGWSLRYVSKHGVTTHAWLVAADDRAVVKAANDCDIGVGRLVYAYGRVIVF